jgi:hypothetical protein
MSRAAIGVGEGVGVVEGVGSGVRVAVGVSTGVEAAGSSAMPSRFVDAQASKRSATAVANP